MCNKDIRDLAILSGVKLWEIADVLGISDSNFSRKLRHELAPEEKNEIFDIIKKLSKKEVKTSENANN